jgi:translation initiation factor RLI1
MGRKTALVDYDRCRPQQCPVCLAAAACERRLMAQESILSPPMTDPGICRGCGDCVRACPLKAVSITSQ